MRQAADLLRSPLAAVYAFILVTNVSITAFFALAPTFRAEFALSKVETSILFAATGVVTLLLALPMGMLADRIGTHRVTVGAAVVLVVASVAHAVAVDLWTLFAGRLLFGVGIVAMFTAGVARLAHSVPSERRARAIAGVMPAAGVGAFVGPYLAGGLTDAASIALAYAVLAGLGAAVAIWVARAPPASGDTGIEPPSLAAVRMAARAPVVAAAAVLMALGVVVDIVSGLLAPLQLAENGLSAGEIGAVLSVGWILYVATALIVTRHAERAVSLAAGVVAGLLIAAAMVPLAASTGTVAQAGGLLARSVGLGLAFTVAFPLGALGAVAAGTGIGAANGLLMLSVGLTSSVAPIGSAGLASVAGDRAVYVLIAGLALCASVLMILVRIRVSRRPRSTSLE